MRETREVLQSARLVSRRYIVTHRRGLDDQDTEVRARRPGLNITLLMARVGGGGWSYLHSGSDDVHGIGEDGSSGGSQGA